METSTLKPPLAKQNGSWLDEWGACKVCDGELPHGHTENCDMFKLEQEVRDLRLRVASSVKAPVPQEKWIDGTKHFWHEELQAWVPYAGG